jgi:hypothetical protein
MGGRRLHRTYIGPSLDLDDLSKDTVLMLSVVCRLLVCVGVCRYCNCTQ